jgi:hypothetical protein
MKLSLLGRPGCHLCEELEQELQAHFAGRVAIEQADVDSRPDWRERFGRRIPVLLDETGAVVCEVHLDLEAVERLLA